MDTKEVFAQVIYQALHEMEIELEDIMERAPKGFWDQVVRYFQSQGIKKDRGGEWDVKQASQYWKRHKDAIISIIHELNDVWEEEDHYTSEKESPDRITNVIPTGQISENEVKDQLPDSEPNTNIVPTTPNRAKCPKQAELTGPPAPESIKELSELTEEIIEMLQWWRGKKDQQIHLGEARPILDGGEGQKNTGVKVDVKILRMATVKAQKERAQTGGSVSKLVELLLWKYLGEPKEFIVS